MAGIKEKRFLLLETQAARKKKIRSACAIVKTAFSQNSNSATKAKILVRSDPIRSGIRSDPDFVNGQYQKAFQSAMSPSFAGKQIT